MNQSLRNIVITDGRRRSEEQFSNPAFSAQEVANKLSSSLRRNKTLPVHTNTGNNLIDQECSSIQCLVESAAPINQDSIIGLNESKPEEQFTW